MIGACVRRRDRRMQSPCRDSRLSDGDSASRAVSRGFHRGPQDVQDRGASDLADDATNVCSPADAGGGKIVRQLTPFEEFACHFPPTRMRF